MVTHASVSDRPRKLILPWCQTLHEFISLPTDSLLKAPLFSLDLFAGLIAGLVLNFNCTFSKIWFLLNISSGCIPLFRFVLSFVHSHFSNLHLSHANYYHKLLLTSHGLWNFEGMRGWRRGWVRAYLTKCSREKHKM